MFYEEERQKAKERQQEAGEVYGNGKEKVVPDLEHAKSDGRTNEILAKKAGIGKSSMAYLLAVYKARPDIFDGEYSINKAYTWMIGKWQPVVLLQFILKACIIRWNFMDTRNRDIKIKIFVGL